MTIKSFTGLVLLITGGGFIGYGLNREPEIHGYMLIAGFILLGVGGFLFGSLFGKNTGTLQTPARIMPLLYAGFTLLGVYQLFKGSPQDSMSSLGIALAFDPFNPNISWKQRPVWQKIWLVIHLTTVLVLLAGLFTDASFLQDLQEGFNNGIGRKQTI